MGYNKSRAYRAELEEETATYAETARLANDRYRGGATGFLEVLTTQQRRVGNLNRRPGLGHRLSICPDIPTVFLFLSRCPQTGRRHFKMVSSNELEFR